MSQSETLSFDREEVLEEFDNDLVLLGRMLEVFRGDCDNRLPKIKAAFESGKLDTLADEAHGIKSGVGNFFASQSYETASALEVAGRDGNSEAIGPLIQKLESELEVLKKDIEETCQNSG
ncbi:MAG: Hpt domain-containing protein [Verrucomicrobiales bacterium]|nr:Hpt domain-containing protein [Verrucomicrobiales bacterium]